MSYRVNTLLGFLLGANFNVTTDQNITMNAALWIARRIVVTNASVSLTTAVGGFYTGAAKTGNVIVAATQVYTFLTATTVYLDLVLASSGLTATQTANPLILALTTAQGAAATADVYVLGDVLR